MRILALAIAALTASASLAQAAGLAPINLAATPATTTSATLTWRTPSDPADIDYYVIYRNGTQLSDHPTLNTVTLSVPTGGSYSFTVAAHYRSSGIGSQSSAVIARPLPSNRGPMTIYADATLPADITDGSYSVATRSGGGNNGNAYNTIQAAVFNMRPGDTLYLRGGTFHEMNIYIGKLASGRADAWYTIASYPGEWAIVDGQHNLAIAHTNTYNGSIFRGTTVGGAQGYIKFDRLEITGGGRDLTDPQYPSAGSGITMCGGPFAFRHLYIHNNYGAANNNNAGLRFDGATGDTRVEYCRFKANGQIRIAGPTTSVANLMIFADYNHEKTVTRYHATTGYCTATMNNEVRYNLFEADSGLSGGGVSYYSVTGFKHKGMQRQTGLFAVDSGYSGDLAPNGSSLDDTGDRIHHNIFLDHPVAVEVDQDYTQVHNNIIWSKNWGNYSGNAIQGRDANSGRRGPHDFVVYNNTIFGNGVTSINHHPVPQGWPGSDWPADLPQDVPYAECWFHNNLLDNPGMAWHTGKITVQSDQVTCTGYPLSDIHLGRNYFYNTSADDLFYIHQTYYDKAAIEATPCADKVFWQARDAADHAFAADYSASPALAAKYLTRGSHVIEGAYTIANAGIGGAHPYLSGVTFPSYIGATNPNDNGWVAGVLGLAEMSNLINGGAGDPSWIEGGSGNHAPVLAPVGSRSTPAGQSLQITVQASDADGDSLQYSASSN